MAGKGTPTTTSRIPVLRARLTGEQRGSPLGTATPKTPARRVDDKENASPTARHETYGPWAGSAEKKAGMRFLDLDLRDELAVVRDPVSAEAERRMLLELHALRQSSDESDTADRATPSAGPLPALSNDGRAPGPELAAFTTSAEDELSPSVACTPSSASSVPASAHTAETAVLWQHLVDTVYNVHRRPPLDRPGLRCTVVMRTQLRFPATTPTTL